MKAQRQARTTLAFSLSFVAAAAIVALVEGVSWPALHLLLAGGLVLAISGASVLFTVTWSAAPAPPDGLMWAQRLAVSVGAATVIAAVQADLAAAVVAGGVLYGSGLVLLLFTLVRTRGQAVEDRFDPAVVGYVCAVAAGLCSLPLGAWMAIRGADDELSAAHAAANVLGLVGITVAATLPYFVATVARTRMSPRATRRRLFAADAWLGGSVLALATGALTGAGHLAALALAAYTAGVAFTFSLLPRMGGRQFRWAGPRLAGILAGCLWWFVGLVAWTAETWRTGRPHLDHRWLWTLIVGGYAQILWGSLAYLLPVLRGGGHKLLAEGFSTTRSWVGLLAANVTAVGLVSSRPYLAATAAFVWGADTFGRVARLAPWRRHGHHTPPGTPTPADIQDSHTSTGPGS